MTMSGQQYDKQSYSIMQKIEENNQVSQRDLSRDLGVSLGSVNVLINKMVKEGLIKMERVTSRQAMYMLTPKGVMEKTMKTLSYVKHHYRAIYESKEAIKAHLLDMQGDYEVLFFYVLDPDLQAIVNLALGELEGQLAFDVRTHWIDKDLKDIGKGKGVIIYDQGPYQDSQDIDQVNIASLFNK